MINNKLLKSDRKNDGGSVNRTTWLEPSLEHVFREMPIGFLIFSHIGDVRFKLDYANQEAKTLLGIDHLGGAELRFSDCFFGSQERRLATNLLKVLKTGRRFKSDEVFIGDDATDRYVYRFVAYSLSGKDLAVTLRDITKQRFLEAELRENRERLRTLAEITFDAVVVHKKGYILYVNPAFVSMFGYKISGIVGEQLTEFVVSTSRDLISAVTRGGSVYRLKTEGKRKNGSIFPVEIVERSCIYKGCRARIAIIRATEEREMIKALEEENRALSRLSITDGLTGLTNHRYFKACLRREVERSRRTGLPLSLIMIDIDHFKHLNDRYGHQVGDAVLVRIAKTLLAKRRINDTVARYGGEEFAIILPDTRSRAAAKVAERLRVRSASQTFFCGNHRIADKITLSFGVAGYPLDATGPDGLISAADKALYDAKRLGRNRVELASKPDRLRVASVNATDLEALTLVR